MPDLRNLAEPGGRCPSCNHPWTAHGPDGCAYAEPGGCWCANTGAASPAAAGHTARHLVEQALHLCQHGERAPGAGPWPAETWPEWARRAEEWLRSEPAREPLDVDRLVTEEMVQRAWTGVLHALPGPHQYPGDDVLRVAICSVAADLHGREAGRGDLIWHEERVRRECAADLRALHRSSLTERGTVRVVGSEEEAYCVRDGRAWPCEEGQFAARWSADPDQDSRAGG